MSRSNPVDETLDKINERDAEARIDAEHQLLDKAHSLTNGKSGDAITQGEVLLGLTTKVIEISSNTREIIAVLPTLQTKSECIDAQTKHVRGLNLPTNITVISTVVMLFGFAGKILGWW